MPLRNPPSILGSITLTGALLFSPDNTVDIGATGATRPRDLWLGRDATLGQANTNADSTLTVGAGGSAQTANRVVGINLKVPSNGVLGTQAGGTFIDFTRNATLIWEIGMDNASVPAGAKTAKDDIAFYSAQSPASYVFAINKHGSVNIAQKVDPSQTAALTVTPGAHTTMTAEIVSENFAHGTVTITGAFATQRFGIFAQPTISAASALTVTTAINLDITAAPAVASSAIITNSYALRVAATGTTLASATGVTYAPIFVPAHTLTLTGTTQMTTAPSVRGLSLPIITVTDASAITVDAAATLYIAGAPLAAGSVTLTNTYSLWVDAGSARFDGNMGFFSTAPAAQQTSGANLTNNVTAGGTDDTIANYTDLTTYATDAAAIRNNLYQLARKVKQLNDGLRLFGLFT